MTQRQRQRLRRLFNEAWRFHLGEAEGAEHNAYDDGAWREVRLPHDWSIEQPFDPAHRPSNGYLPQGVCWYRRSFRPDGSAETTLLQFEGVYMDATVWVNGSKAGRHVYGYTGFELDISPYLIPGEDNVVAVRADSTTSLCRWYSGSGIYRNVWLSEGPGARLETGGTYVRTGIRADGSAAGDVRNVVLNGGATTVRYRLETAIVDSDGRAEAFATTSGAIGPGETATVSQTFELRTPRMWSVDEPNLYVARTTLHIDGEVADSRDATFGVRDAVFDPDEGFKLNGKRLKLKGVCLHHDAGCLGAAAQRRSYERQLRGLKAIGCNAIRTAHNPPSEAFLDLCDRMGFLVIDEFHDSWKFEHGGRRNALIEWDDWWEEDLRHAVRRDRNHPSVVLWSVGNELPNQGDPEMVDWLKRLIAVVREEDPGRPVTCALAPRSFPSVQEKLDHVLGLAPHMDVLSLNYQEPLYELLKATDPSLVILGTETLVYYRNKLDSSPGPSYEASNPWFDVAKHDYVAGQFVWAGIDYLGEAMFWTDMSGWPNKGWSGTLIDRCGVRKPISFFHESVWSDRPTVRIAVFDDASPLTMRPPMWSAPRMVAHWTLPHRATRMATVATYTNCETVELRVNGRSCGSQRLADWPDRTMLWHVPYAEGTIEAVARHADGSEATCVLKTAGPPVKLALSADEPALNADGQDVVYVEALVTDAEGNVVPGADHLIDFRIEGEGELVGVDNGDPLSGERFQGPSRSAFMGRVLAVVRSNGNAGTVTLSATAEGLEEASLTLSAISATPSAAVSRI
ncbi:glycoside hydrolase family 2 TIM barrel-domain containing protein [Cohnella sp. GCM10027633]|uniref:glycoside hydrolase family 2 TIM barrel-domain containing protein n=1 Tax=unclassified Cohnella TaxID=2636738 RepID=UPI00362FC66F